MRKNIASLVCLVLFLAQAAHGDQFSAARDQAAAAIASGHYSDALRVLTPLLKTHLHDRVLWTLQGLALNGLGQTNKSLASFDRALSIDKSFAPALEGALQTAYLHGDPRASQYSHRLLAIMPENQVANAMAGVLAYQSHDCTNSIMYFERSKGEVFQDQNALSEFADCLLHKEMIGQAVQILAQGSQVHPDSSQLKYNLAVAELQDHHPAEAIRVLAPLASKNDSELLNLLASAYTQAHLPDEALRSLESAIEINPKEESNYLDLAILCLEHNKETTSVTVATEGISKIPDAASLFLIRGVAYAQLAEYDNAERDFSKAAELQPSQPNSGIAMSLLYSEKNQPGQEKALLQKQLKLTPNDAVTNYLLADLLIRQGAEPGQFEFDEARAALARSLVAKPDSAEAQILMGNLLEQQNIFLGALSHFQLALKADPDNRSALSHEFRLLRKLNRNRESTEVLDHLKAVINEELNGEKAADRMRISQPTSEQ